MRRCRDKERDVGNCGFDECAASTRLGARTPAPKVTASLITQAGYGAQAVAVDGVRSTVLRGTAHSVPGRLVELAKRHMIEPAGWTIQLRKRVVMIETACSEVRSGEHVVHFYEHTAELAQTVGRYLADTIHAGGLAVVIATETHRQAIGVELERAGIDPVQAVADDTLLSLDAAQTLAAFMPGERIDTYAFRRVVGPMMQRAAQAGRPVHAYGEMVALLWDAGDVLGAIELEELWTQLGRELQFSLLCGYRSTSVSGPEHAEALEHICQLHSSVLQAPRAAGQAGDHSGASATEVFRRFPAEREAPRAARGFVADAMRRWGHSGTLLDDSVLVVSELATNAVVHARSTFSVVARREGSGVRLSVHDLSTAKPVLRSAPPLAPSGRGLQLVADITSEWGVETTSAGKTVWAELRP